MGEVEDSCWLVIKTLDEFESSNNGSSSTSFSSNGHVVISRFVEEMLRTGTIPGEQNGSAPASNGNGNQGEVEEMDE